jgi:hypothetical protein
MRNNPSLPVVTVLAFDERELEVSIECAAILEGIFAIRFIDPGRQKVARRPLSR